MVLWVFAVKKKKKEIPVYMVMVMNVTFAMTESSNLITQKLSSVVAVAQQVIWELEGWYFDSWLLQSMYQSVLKQDTELWVALSLL